MEDVFVEIGWTSGTKEEALARAKAIFMREGGWEIGQLDETQSGPDWVCGNLEIEDGLYESVAETDEAWEATDGVVTVRFECP